MHSKLHVIMRNEMDTKGMKMIAGGIIHTFPCDYPPDNASGAEELKNDVQNDYMLGRCGGSRCLREHPVGDLVVAIRHISICDGGEEYCPMRGKGGRHLHCISDVYLKAGNG